MIINIVVSIVYICITFNNIQWGDYDLFKGMLIVNITQ